MMIKMMMTLYRDQHVQLVVQVLPVWLPSVLLLLQVQQRSASGGYTYIRLGLVRDFGNEVGDQLEPALITIIGYILLGLERV